MSESDTMFNERDRRCPAVQLMLYTDQSYDNRTIASTLKMKIWTVQHLRHCSTRRTTLWGGVERKPKAEDTARKTRTKEFIEKVQAIIEETPQRPIRQIARDLGISHTTVNAYIHTYTHTHKHIIFPAGWGCRIHWLHLCRGARPPQRVSWYDTK